ncbi:MAG: trehalase [Xanthomonadales bacterium]|nr:trehalase [Xanthomonadales bacterium]ODU93024.1 MAG: trehalase [Rhodanobacter sp. SCN 66-43]OJY83807.1 MAG: trehalase [Xanthomonadales bacterium 66-474]
MKVRPLFVVFALTALVATTSFAATPDPAKTRSYIDHAWSTLTRSVNECRALVDPKVPSRSVIYLPAGVTAPASLAQSAKRCGVKVENLPTPIHELGDVDPTRLPAQGLLYLPHPYVVPGGFFNEMYGWDSYFIVLGLVADHRQQLALDMVDNALYEVEYYGGVLNANRTYYLTRSQPPLLTAMMTAVMDDPASFKDAAAKRAWLEKAYPLAVRNYEIWTRKQHLAGDTGLSRYFDFGHGPVIEMPDSDYYVGVIRWLLAHPSENPGYLIKAPQHPDKAQAETLKTTSCDVTKSKICAGDWLDGYRLTADYYLGDRAMRESGFDTDFHFGPWGGSTHHYAGAGLNSLLYKYARDLHDFAAELGKADDAQRWADAAAARKNAMDKYLWHADQGRYMDWDFVAGKASTDPYLTMFYPLWAGAASPQQAKALVGQLKLFEHKGGLAMSTRDTGAQWDAPFGWAPTNWIAAKGLQDYGFRTDALRISCAFTGTIDRSLAKDGTIREKYNMVLGNADVKITAGYKANVIGFGWTNGVYLKMDHLIAADGGCKSAPAAPSAAAH